MDRNTETGEEVIPIDRSPRPARTVHTTRPPEIQVSVTIGMKTSSVLESMTKTKPSMVVIDRSSNPLDACRLIAEEATKKEKRTSHYFLKHLLPYVTIEEHRNMTVRPIPYARFIPRETRSITIDKKCHQKGRNVFKLIWALLS